jgi:hypothetical protein
MPKGKKPIQPTDSSAVSVAVEAFKQELRHQTAILLEDIRSQNKLTAESVSVKVDALAQELRDGLRESRDRDALLESAVRSARTDLNRVETGLKSDIKRVEVKVDRLVPLEERVAALERPGLTSHL